MKVSTIQIKNGLSKYIDTEFASKLTGLGKWLVPMAGAAIINHKMDSLIHTHSEMLKNLGYLSDDGMIEIDKLYNDAKRIAHDKGSVTESFPMLGEVTFSEMDIDNLRRMIM